MKHLLSILLLLVISLVSEAHNNQPISVKALEELVRTHPDSVITQIAILEQELDSEEMLPYQLVKAKAYILSGKLKDAGEVVDQLIEAEPGDSILLQANYLKAAVLFYTNNPNEGMELYKKVYHEAMERADTNMIAKVAANLSASYIKKDQYDSALIYLKTSYEIDKANNDSAYIASDHVYFGVCYNALQLYDQAIAEFLKALAFKPDPTTEANAYYNLAVSYSKTGQPDSTFFYGKKAENLYREFNNTSGIIRLSTVLGTAHFAKRNFKKAIEYHLKSMELAKEQNDERSLSIAQNNLAMCYTYLNDSEKAVYYARKAFESNMKLGLIDFAANAAENLGIGYAMNSQGDSAQKYIEVSDSLRQMLIKSEYIEKLGQFQSQLQLAEKEATIAKNQIKMQQQELDLQSYRSNLYLSIFLLVILLILGFGLFVYVKNRQKQQLQKIVIEEKELSLKREIQATEKEKSRLSKELHDGIGQELSALKMNLGVIINSLNDQELKDQLGNVNEQLGHSARGVRTISHQMMPRALEENGLTEAIDDLLQVSFLKSNIEYEFNTGQSNLNLSDELQIALYRIVQESLNNIIKYSKANKVYVQLYQVDDDIILNIEDDGIGFEQKQNVGHGLQNMKSRIQVFDGALMVDSTPGEGTRITARVKAETSELKKTA
ncbi:tetratricopeptide repeat-containing sensor histidine kinase [Halocola ammonii]